MIVVVSQPMFLPWLGLFEQVKLADVFVHYDDVQLPQGRSFMSRVQLKTRDGLSWLSAPVDRARSGRMINECWYKDEMGWRTSHLNTLKTVYQRAPHFEEMYVLAEAIYSFSDSNIAAFNAHGVETIASYLGLKPRFLTSSSMRIDGSSTQRLVDICASLEATSYVTGLGALNYLEDEKFRERGIKVRYMNYGRAPYPQLHGEFTPYVTALDAIANCGHETAGLLISGALDRESLPI